MTETFIWTVIIGMALANFAIRFIPMTVVSRMDLPRPVMRWLSYVPVAVMGAIVASEVLTPRGQYIAPWNNPYLLASIPTALVYWKTRSFLGAVVVGMLVFIALRWIMGAA
jgi:branched-subunit amino acid transport protein